MTEGDSRFTWDDVVTFQSGIASRRQAVQMGVSRNVVRRRVESGKWQRMQRGVYATFTGQPTREAVLWAAVARVGPGAVLSHETAAEIQELSDKPSSRIHLTVPASSNPARRGEIPGVVIHRSRHVDPDPQPPWQLPRTRIEDTVLDLVAAAKTLDEAYAWISAATGRGLITPRLLHQAMAARTRVKWRAWLAEALDDAEAGVNSALERRYVQGVERAHGLPSARRQSRQRAGGKTCYLDNLYEPYQICVELDGLASHPVDERRRDGRRDNANLAAHGISTMRYGWADATAHRCETAQQVADVLLHGGWSGESLVPCNPSCPVRRPS